MRMLNKILFLAVMYNYIFPVRLVKFHHLAELIVGMSALCFLSILAMNGRLRPMLRPQVGWMLLAWSLLSVTGIFSILFNGTLDLQIVNVLVNYVVTFIYSLLLVSILVSRGSDFAQSLRSVVSLMTISCLVIAISVYLNVFSPTAKQIILEYIYKTGNIDFSESLRGSGLSASGGASLSFALALGGGLALMLAGTSLHKFARVFFYGSAAIILCSTAFVGRSGIVLGLLFLVVFICYMSFRKLGYMLLVSAGLGLIAVFLLPSLPSDAIQYYTHHDLEVVNNYRSGHGVDYGTIGAVNESYFLPDATKILVGSGYMNGVDYNLRSSDPGYMKSLLAFGIFGAGLFYLMSTYICFAGFLFLYRYLGVGKLMSFTFFLSFYIYEWKEPAFFQNYQFRILMLVFALAIVSRNRPGWRAGGFSKRRKIG